MFEYFYHEILRRTVISFGSLFNNIAIRHVNNSDSTVSVIKVPLAYGPTQKFLARLKQSPNLSKPVQMTLPRMSFEFTGLTYDASRKSTTTQYFTVKDSVNGLETKKAYLPVPYNMQFQLSVMAKLNDDALQILEQILPYFQPAYTITVDLVDTIKEKRDIPIILENITMQDDYEGDFSTRRVLLYTLRFTAKTYLFGPVGSATKDVIKKVSIGYVSGDSKSTTRDLSYIAQPRAIKNYTGEITTTLSKDVTTEDTSIEVESIGSITANTYLDLGGEELFVKSILGNTLYVERGLDETTISTHLKGSPVKTIQSIDNSLVEDGDDFGFSGSFE
jgi:hypothetical protein